MGRPLDRNARLPRNRPLCPVCMKKRVYRGGYRCTHCSHDRVARRRVERNDAQLEDTGLRLDTRKGEIIKPDGSRETAPAGLSLRYFFAPHSRGVVKLMRRKGRHGFSI